MAKTRANIDMRGENLLNGQPKSEQEILDEQSRITQQTVKDNATLAKSAEDSAKRQANADQEAVKAKRARVKEERRLNDEKIKNEKEVARAAKERETIEKEALDAIAKHVSYTEKEISVARTRIDRSLKAIAEQMTASLKDGNMAGAAFKISEHISRIFNDIEVASVSVSQKRVDKIKQMFALLSSWNDTITPKVAKSQGIDADFSKKLTDSMNRISTFLDSTIRRIEEQTSNYGREAVAAAKRVERITAELPKSYNATTIAELSRYADALNNFSKILSKHSGTSEKKDITSQMAYFAISEVVKQIRPSIVEHDTTSGSPAVASFDAVIKNQIQNVLAPMAEKIRALKTEYIQAREMGEPTKEIRLQIEETTKEWEKQKKIIQNHADIQNKFIATYNALTQRVSSIEEAKAKDFATRIPDVIIPANIDMVKERMSTFENIMSSLVEFSKKVPESATAKQHIDTIADSLTRLNSIVPALEQAFSDKFVDDAKKTALQEEAAGVINRMNLAVDAFRRTKDVGKAYKDSLVNVKRGDKTGTYFDNLIMLEMMKKDARYQRALEAESIYNAETDKDPRAAEQKLFIQQALVMSGASVDAMNTKINAMIQQATSREIAGIYRIIAQLIKKGSAYFPYGQMPKEGDYLNPEGKLTEQEYSNIFNLAGIIAQSGGFKLKTGKTGDTLSFASNAQFITDLKTQVKHNLNKLLHSYGSDMNTGGYVPSFGVEDGLTMGKRVAVNRYGTVDDAELEAGIKEHEELLLALEMAEVNSNKLRPLLASLFRNYDLEARVAKRIAMRKMPTVKGQSRKLAELMAEADVSKVDAAQLGEAGYLSEEEVKKIENMSDKLTLPSKENSAFKLISTMKERLNKYGAGGISRLGSEVFQRMLVEHIASAPYQQIMSTLSGRNGLEIVARQAVKDLYTTYGSTGLKTLGDNAELITQSVGQKPMREIFGNVIAGKQQFGSADEAMESLRALIINKRIGFNMNTNANTIDKMMSVFTVMSQFDKIAAEIPLFAKLAKNITPMSFEDIKNNIVSGHLDEYIKKFTYGRTPIKDFAEGSGASNLARLEGLLKKVTSTGDDARLTKEISDMVRNKALEYLQKQISGVTTSPLPRIEMPAQAIKQTIEEAVKVPEIVQNIVEKTADEVLTAAPEVIKKKRERKVKKAADATADLFEYAGLSEPVPGRYRDRLSAEKFNLLNMINDAEDLGELQVIPRHYKGISENIRRIARLTSPTGGASFASATAESMKEQLLLTYSGDGYGPKLIEQDSWQEIKKRSKARARGEAPEQIQMAEYDKLLHETRVRRQHMATMDAIYADREARLKAIRDNVMNAAEDLRLIEYRRARLGNMNPIRTMERRAEKDMRKFDMFEQARQEALKNMAGVRPLYSEEELDRMTHEIAMNAQYYYSPDRLRFRRRENDSAYEPNFVLADNRVPPAEPRPYYRKRPAAEYVPDYIINTNQRALPSPEDIDMTSAGAIMLRRGGSFMKAAYGQKLINEYGGIIGEINARRAEFEEKGGSVEEFNASIKALHQSRNRLARKIHELFTNDVNSINLMNEEYQKFFNMINTGYQEDVAEDNIRRAAAPEFNRRRAGGDDRLNMRNRIFRGEINMKNLSEIAQVISTAQQYGKMEFEDMFGNKTFKSTEFDIFNAKGGDKGATGQTRFFADNMLRYLRSRRESFTRSMADYGITGISNPFIQAVEELESNILSPDGKMKTSDEMKAYFTSDKFKRIFINRLQSNVNEFDKQLKDALRQMFGSNWENVYNFINAESDILRKGGVYGTGGGASTLYHQLMSKGGMPLSGNIITGVDYKWGEGSNITWSEGNEYDWIRSKFMRQKPPKSEKAPFDSFTGQMYAASTYEGALNNLMMRTTQVGYDIPDLMQTMNLSFTKAAFAFSRVAYGMRVMSMELMALKGMFAYSFKTGLNYAERYTESVIKATETQKKAGIVLTGIFNQDTSNKMLDFARRYAVTSPATFDEIITMTKSFGLNPKTKSMIETSTNVDKTLGELAYLTIGLGSTKPEQGVKGAAYAMREAMAGQFVSLRRRFEIMPEALAAAGGTTLDKMKKDPLEFVRSLKAFLDLNVGENTLKNLSMTYEVQMNNIKDFIEQTSAMIGENGFYGHVMKLAASVAESFKMLLPVDFFKAQLKEMSDALSIFSTVYVEGITTMINNMFAPINRTDLAILKDSDPEKFKKEAEYLEQTNKQRKLLAAQFGKDLAAGHITKGANMEDYVNRGMAVSRVLNVIRLSLFGFTLIFDKVLGFFTKLFGGIIRDSKDAEKAITRIVEQIWKFVSVILDVFTTVFGMYWKVITTINDMQIGSGLKTVLFFFTAFPIASANMIINTLRFFGESLLMFFNPTVVTSMSRITSNLVSFAGAFAGYMRAMLDPRMALATSNAMTYLASNDELRASIEAYRTKKLSELAVGPNTAEGMADYARRRAELNASIDANMQSIAEGMSVPKNTFMKIGTRFVSMLAWGIRVAGAALIVSTIISSVAEGFDKSGGGWLKGFENTIYRFVGGLKALFSNIIPDSLKTFIMDMAISGGIIFALFPYHSIALISSIGSLLTAALLNPIVLATAALATFFYLMNEATKKLRQLSGEKDTNAVISDILKNRVVSKQGYTHYRMQNANTGFAEQGVEIVQALSLGMNINEYRKMKYGQEYKAAIAAMSEEDIKLLVDAGYEYVKDTKEFKPSSKGVEIANKVAYIKKGSTVKPDGTRVIGGDVSISYGELIAQKASGYSDVANKPMDIEGDVTKLLKTVSSPVVAAADWFSDFLGFGKDKKEEGKKALSGIKQLFVDAGTGAKEGGEILSKDIREAIKKAKAEFEAIDETQNPLAKRLQGDMMNKVWANKEVLEAISESDKFFKKDDDERKERLKTLLSVVEQAKKDAFQTERDLYIAKNAFDLNIAYINIQLKMLASSLMMLTNQPYAIKLRLEAETELAAFNRPNVIGFNPISGQPIYGASNMQVYNAIVSNAEKNAKNSTTQTTLKRASEGLTGSMADIGKGAADKALEQEKKYYSEKARLMKEILESEHKDLEARMEYLKYESAERIKAMEKDFAGTKYYEEMKTLVTQAEEAKRKKAREDAIKEIYEKVLSNKWASPESQMRAYDFINNIEIKKMTNNLDYMAKEGMLSAGEIAQIREDYVFSKQMERIEKQYDILKNQPKLHEILGGKDAEKVLDNFNVKLAKYVNISEKHLSLIKNAKVQWDLMNTETVKSSSGKILEQTQTYQLRGKIPSSAVEGDSVSATRDAMSVLRNVYYQNSILMLKQEIEYEKQLSELQMQRMTDTAFEKRFGMSKEYAKMLRDIIGQVRLLAQAEEQYYKMKEQKAKESNSIAEQMNFALVEQVRKLPTQYDIVKSATESMFNTLRDGLSNTLAAAFSGDVQKMKDSWKEFLTTLKNTFLKMVADLTVNNMMKSMFGSLLAKDEKEKKSFIDNAVPKDKDDLLKVLPGLNITNPNDLVQNIADPLANASMATANTMTSSFVPAVNIATEALYRMSSAANFVAGGKGGGAGFDWSGYIDDAFGSDDSWLDSMLGLSDDTFDLGMDIADEIAQGLVIPGGADGGLVSAPTLAVVGEGRYNEAIVPMPNGRAIPVDLRNKSDERGGEQALTIINVVDASVMEEFLAQNPDSVINIISSDTLKGGKTYQAQKAKSGK